MTSLVIIAKDDLVAFQYGRRRDKHKWRKVICVGKFCQEIAKFCFLSEKAKVIRGCNIYCGMVWILGSQFTCHIIVKVEVPLSPLNPENPVNPVPKIPRDSGSVKSRIPTAGFGILTSLILNLKFYYEKCIFCSIQSYFESTFYSRKSDFV